MAELGPVLAVGAAVRLIIASSALPSYLSKRNEISSPVTSFARLQEGAFVAHSLGQDPYDGGSFHQSPLLLTLPFASNELVWVVYALADVCVAAALYAVAKRREHKRPVIAAAAYLLHPFALATFASRSTLVFTNALTSVAIYAASTGNLVSAVMALSTATQLGLYPALLLPSLLLLAHRSNQSSKLSRTVVLGSIAFVGHFAATLAACRQALGSWSFIKSFYGVVLTIPDLTPTIGLGWYFFIEMFDHFRLFFVGVFQLHCLIYVVPFCYYCRDDPLFAAMLQWGVVFLFGTYPELGYFALLHALMAILSSYHSYLSRLTFFVPVTLYALALLPSFHHLWLYEGSGNANFFYASTLVWTVGQGGLLVDWLSAYGKDQVRKHVGDSDWTDKVKTGKWHIVQR